jgi:hypothetical protein
MVCEGDWIYEAVCLDAKNRDNKDLWGYAHLNDGPWQTSPQEIARRSWAAHEANPKRSFHVGAMILNLADISESKLRPEPLLPVCKSSDIVIKRLDEKHDRMMPHECGGIAGQDTKQLLGAIDVQHAAHKQTLFVDVINYWTENEKPARAAADLCATYYSLYPTRRDGEHLWKQGKTLCEHVAPIVEGLNEDNEVSVLSLKNIIYPCLLIHPPNRKKRTEISAINSNIGMITIASTRYV